MGQIQADLFAECVSCQAYWLLNEALNELAVDAIVDVEH